MMRAFIAIPLPEAIRKGLEEVSGRLSGEGLRGSYARSEAIHLTLKFLGDIEERQVDAIGDRMETACRPLAPFSLRIGRLGVFPDLTRPRVVWVGLAPSDPLEELHRSLEAELAGLGFPPRDRPFKPHLTLLRLKSRHNTRVLAEMCARQDLPDFPPMKAGQLTLYRSILHPQGARHTKLRAVEIAGG